MKNLCLVFTLLAALAGRAPLIAQDSETAKGAVLAKIGEACADLETIYRDLHAHPELSLQEAQTAAKVAAELKRLGFEATSQVGGHGVVGVLRNGVGPTILLRTDLDALPVREQTGLPYASKAKVRDPDGKEVDVMHACGHDMHMTCVLGAARVLSQIKDRWSGTLIAIGQPAEERGAGAKAMLADGLFTRFPRPDYCLALHVTAELPAGTIGYTEGYAAANVDSVDLLIRGVGGHGAYPHKTKDPIVLAAQTVLALQTIDSREIDPTDPVVVTVGSIHGGTKHNIIPDEVKLQLTLRSYSDEVRKKTLAAIERIARGLALAAGVPEDRLPVMSLAEDFLPSAYNTPELTRRWVAVLKAALGEKQVIARKPTMGGEDFGEYGRTEAKIPICMLGLGSVEPERVAESERTGQPLPSLHSAFYRPVPQPTIRTGVLALSLAVLDLAANPQTR
jgi:hippurate hydrolase